MTPKLARFCPVAAVLGLVSPTSLHAQAVTPPKRVALLVGINDHDHNGLINLRRAENDVDETAKELTRIGFDKVVTMKGSSPGGLRATKNNIEAEVDKLLTGIGKARQGEQKALAREIEPFTDAVVIRYAH